MCGRFTLTAGQRGELEARFGAALPIGGGLERYNVAPTEEVLAVCGGRGGREARLLRWGLIPHWVKDLRGGARMINARAETVGSKAPRVPFRFTVDGGAPFAFAGLWTRARVDGERVRSVTILTTTPNPMVGRLHDRMPVILPDAEAEAAWLSADVAGAEALELCRTPLPEGRMAVVAANPAVNKPDPDAEGPHLLSADAA